MKNLFMCIISAVVLFCSNAFCQEHGRFAVQSAVDPFKLSDLMSAISSNAMEPSCVIGIRAYASDRFGFDLGTGIVYNSGYDSSNGNSESFGIRSILIRGGFVYEAFQGERACVGINGKLGFSFQQWSTYSYSGTYLKYSVTVPSIYFGFEPAYYLSKNISLFSEFGVKIMFNPNSKSATGSSLGGYTLESNKDASTSIATDGLSLGLRYFF
jgi:hypothetical protein